MFGSTLRRLASRLRTKPLRLGLMLMQVVLGSLAMTVALNAYLGTQGDSDARAFGVVAGSRESDTRWSIFSASDMQRLLTLAPAVEAIARYGYVFSSDLLAEGERYAVRRAARVDPAFFDLAGIELIRGSFFTQAEAADKAAVAVVSEDVARVLFNGADPIGRSFTLLPSPALPDPPPRRTYRVVGTFRYEANALLSYYSRPAPVYLPAWFESISSSNTSSLRVLAEVGQSAAAREQILAATRQVYRDARELRHYDLDQGEGFYIEELGQDYRYVDRLNPNVLIFGLFGILALAIGAIGIFSSTVVEVAERTHEIGVRRSLGASAGRIGLEFTAEAGLLAVCGGLGGVLLAFLVIPWLNAQIGEQLFSGVRLIWRLRAALTVLLLVSALGAVCSLFPALRMGRNAPVEALQEA